MAGQSSAVRGLIGRSSGGRAAAALGGAAVGTAASLGVPWALGQTNVPEWSRKNDVSWMFGSGAISSRVPLSTGWHHNRSKGLPYGTNQQQSD